MTVANNSKKAFANHNKQTRRQQVFDIYQARGVAMTDRQVMHDFGSVDPNSVRPAITALYKDGILDDLGNVECQETGEDVRVCSIANPPKPRRRGSKITFILDNIDHTDQTLAPFLLTMLRLYILKYGPTNPRCYWSSYHGSATSKKTEIK
jgi:hypothetical protein